MVIWIVGLSASGKSTLGRALADLWKKEEPNTVLIDGDQLREVFGKNRTDDDYTPEARKKQAMTYSRLSSWLDQQGMNVVCCLLSYHPECHEWNQKNLSQYFEVYVSTPLNKCRERDRKHLYAAAIAGQIKNVVGVDLPFNPPTQPDYIFDNSSNLTDLNSVAEKILERVRIRGGLA